VREHAEKYDAIVIEGLWQFPGFGTWLALRGKKTPYFVYTHNMLDPWFKETHPRKHAKKLVYWLLAEHKVLKDARAVLYLSEREKVLASQAFWPYRAKEAVVGLPIDVNVGDPHHQRQLFLDEFPDLENKRLILFLGRIHPIKGCDLLVEAFSQVSHVDSSLNLVFAGPDPVGWQQDLQRRVAELGLEPRVTWTGMLSSEFKWGALHAAEVFVLPSRSEGFPVAAIEAMGCGVPVLISDQVRIWPELKDSGGGFVAGASVSGITELLERWLKLPPNKRESMKSRAQQGYLERFASGAALERFVSTLRAFGVSEK
jgi:glycosyltransferase involved in cell wall biosynthesis